MSGAIGAIISGVLWGGVVLLGLITLLLLWAGVRVLLLGRHISEAEAHAETGRSLSRRFGAVTLLLAGGLGTLAGSLVYRLVSTVLTPALYAWEIAGLLITAVGAWQFQQIRRQLDDSLQELKEET